MKTFLIKIMLVFIMFITSCNFMVDKNRRDDSLNPGSPSYNPGGSNDHIPVTVANLSLEAKIAKDDNYCTIERINSSPFANLSSWNDFSENVITICTGEQLLNILSDIRYMDYDFLLMGDVEIFLPYGGHIFENITEYNGFFDGNGFSIIISDSLDLDYEVGLFENLSQNAFTNDLVIKDNKGNPVKIY